MRTHLLGSVLLVLSIAGCASPSTQTTDESEQTVADEKPAKEEPGPEDWKPIFHEQTPDVEVLQDAEAELVAYFATEVIPPDAVADGGVSYLVERLRAKGEAHYRLEQTLFDLLDDSGMTDTARSHAGFRLGQMYFDFACQIRAVDLPDDLSDSERNRYSDLLHDEYVAPLMVSTKKFSVSGLRFGAQPWAKKMTALANALPDTKESFTKMQAAELCQKHRRIWASPVALKHARTQAPKVERSASGEAGMSALEGVDALYPDPEMGYGRVGSDNESDEEQKE